MSNFSFQPVQAEDFEAMLALRMTALRESLERLGRFDLQRGRERFQAAFAPEFMQHICCGAERIGFMTLKPDGAMLKLEQLYVAPERQDQRVGAWVISWVKDRARAAGQDVTLSALKQSDANRFYLRHGFKQVGESDFDIDYRWTCEVAR
ncbi:GNAT family N-acetyltransferase [Roseateles oligotrophus]|uniref:GNAT family N-acetyltransferase n=1 Tax=Roseateles oligotrophus TaxID=1769250 RepID=A0ABT2YFN4_9BURK|nr:GNAT family N-acetyltransferase [Roseateles oligotrophus]MCV2368829.1 GNAT family N-acetyltransferase [Roseateles oligotrophus]